MILGPTPAGIIGCILFTILSIFILIHIKDDETGKKLILVRTIFH